MTDVHVVTSDSSENLLHHLRTTFGPTYLTLISILQGVLLGLMATLIDENFRSMGPENWMRTIASLLVVILVWNEYRMGATQFVWVPRLVDTLIPFALGGVQWVGIRSSFLDPALWFASIGIFYLLAVAGYENMYRHAGAAGKGRVNRGLITALGRWRVINPLLCGAISAVAGGFGWLVWFMDLSHQTHQVMIAVILATQMGMLWRSELNWKAVIRVADSLPSPARAVR